MSRIGRTTIVIPQGVTVVLDGSTLSVTGPKGKMEYMTPKGFHLKMDTGTVIVENDIQDRVSQAQHGYIRAHIANIVHGVSVGWTKTLELSGVGYRANIDGTNLVLSVGFSHTVTVNPPEGITFSVQDGKIIISGIDKQTVGQIAADIRSIKKPEPYKGKGIRYEGEHVRKKAGKTAKAIGGAPGGAK